MLVDNTTVITTIVQINNVSVSNKSIESRIIFTKEW